jgi:hypothetical protein
MDAEMWAVFVKTYYSGRVPFLSPPFVTRCGHDTGGRDHSRHVRSSCALGPHLRLTYAHV